MDVHIQLYPNPVESKCKIQLDLGFFPNPIPGVLRTVRVDLKGLDGWTMCHAYVKGRYMDRRQELVASYFPPMFLS